MQEYIIYAMLIFVPVGALMEFLLRQEGLVLKYRFIIIAASWAIIISFPILVGHMGIPSALLIYLASIFALSWYFIRVSQGPAWYLRQASSSENDEVYVSERLIDNTRVITLGEIEDDMWFQENRDNLLVDEGAESLLKPEALPVDSSVSGDMNNGEDSEPATQNHIIHFSEEASIIDKIDGQSDYVPDYPIEAIKGSEESEINIIAIKEDSELAEEDSELVAMLNADNLYTEAKLDQNGAMNPEANIATYPDGANKNVTQPVLLDKQIGNLESVTEIKQDTIMANEEEQRIIANSPANSQEDLAEVLRPFEAVDRGDDGEKLLAGKDTSEAEAEMEDLTLPELIASTDQLEAGEVIPPTKAQTSGDTQNKLHEENQLDLMIEKGFALKQEQRYIEASEIFKEATDLATDEELKYLLIMELVNLYQEVGMYAQAEQVLFLSIGKDYTRTDIIDKIDRQLSYIRLLSVELDRLGLANTPISEVPRMVKISMAEIMD